MKTLIVAGLLFGATAAYATCEDVYNPFSGQWEYQCTPQPSAPRPPSCHQEFDPLNSRWVTVCN